MNGKLPRMYFKLSMLIMEKDKRPKTIQKQLSYTGNLRTDIKCNPGVYNLAGNMLRVYKTSKPETINYLTTMQRQFAQVASNIDSTDL